MKRFFLSNDLLGKDEQESISLLEIRYPLGSVRSGPWRNTILHGAKRKLQTLKIVRLMGEQNASLEQLMSYSGASNATVVDTRKRVRGFCLRWQRRQMLEGEVEIDELMLRGKRGKGRRNQAILVIAGKQGGPALYLPLKDQKAETILPLIEKHVAVGATIYTDGWVGYKRLASLGYTHKAKKQAKLPRAHAAIAAWRSFLGQDRRPETDLAGKCAHASLLYSHRSLGKSRADALLDACMQPGRPRQDTGTHVVRLSLSPSRVEQDMLYRRLRHQDLFVHLLQKRARARLHDLARSRAWRQGDLKQRKALWNQADFTQYSLEAEATQVLQCNPDIADYVDRATANGLVMEVYSTFRRAIWSGASLPQFKKRDTWHGTNQRQGLRVVDGHLVHSTARLRADRRLHLPLSWHSVGAQRQEYYQQRMSALRRVSMKRQWVRGRPRWFALLTFECLPYRDQGYLDALPADGVVGLDVNKGCIGVASSAGAQTIDLSQLARGLSQKADRLRSQRDLIKQRNPEWASSKRYWRAHNRFTRASRNARLARDQVWRGLARSLRQAGSTIITEKDHIAAWKRGRSRDTIAQSVAPARLKQLVRSEFQATDGTYQEVTAKAVKATATCPDCRRVEGKLTRERVHDCACGCKMDRDSAAAINLARYKAGKKESYPIRHRGVLLLGDAYASGPAGGQLLVSTSSDTPAVKRPHTRPLDFYKFREKA